MPLQEHQETGQPTTSMMWTDKLLTAIEWNDVAGIQQAIQKGADVNGDDYHGAVVPLVKACDKGDDRIVRILLDAGADAQCTNYDCWSPITKACQRGHVSIVKMLIRHDNDLLEFMDDNLHTPLSIALENGHVDVVRFLLECGADAQKATRDGSNSFHEACTRSELDIVRLLRAAGVDVETRDENQQTALHHTAIWNCTESLRELIVEHNANMFAVDESGFTPFDYASNLMGNGEAARLLLAMYASKLTADHGRLALHELLKVAKYSFAESEDLHPPLLVGIPLGTLKMTHWRTLLHSFDMELTRNRDDEGKLPIHIACRAYAPDDEVFAMLIELHCASNRGLQWQSTVARVL